MVVTYLTEFRGVLEIILVLLLERCVSVLAFIMKNVSGLPASLPEYLISVYGEICTSYGH